MDMVGFSSLYILEKPIIKGTVVEWRVQSQTSEDNWYSVGISPLPTKQFDNARENL